MFLQSQHESDQDAKQSIFCQEGTEDTTAEITYHQAGCIQAVSHQKEKIVQYYLEEIKIAERELCVLPTAAFAAYILANLGFPLTKTGQIPSLIILLALIIGCTLSITHAVKARKTLLTIKNETYPPSNKLNTKIVHGQKTKNLQH